MKANPEARARVLRARELARAQREYDTMVPVVSVPAPARKLSKPRIGPRMQEIADYVSGVPGCTKSDALRAAGLDPRGQLGARRPLDRAIAAGLVVVEHDGPNRCLCFANQRDRKRWYLRRELLQPGTSAERVVDIRAEIARLDAERAATWTAA